MNKIVFSNPVLISDFLAHCQRPHLDFQEYTFPGDDDLRNLLKNKTGRIMNQADSFSLIALSQDKPVGLLTVV